MKEEGRIEDNNKATDSNSADKLRDLIIENIKEGHDKPTILKKLTNADVKEDTANKVLEQTYSYVRGAIKQEQFSLKSLLLAILGALVAMVIGGMLWSFIVNLTGYEIGYMAWGLGFLSGLAVIIFSGGKKGLSFQIVAVIASVLGILIGKYLVYFNALKEALMQLYEVEMTSSMFSGSVIMSFFESMGSMVGIYDAIWLVLAVLTAWNITQGIGIKEEDIK